MFRVSDPGEDLRPLQSNEPRHIFQRSRGSESSKRADLLGFQHRHYSVEILLDLAIIGNLPLKRRVKVPSPMTVRSVQSPVDHSSKPELSRLGRGETTSREETVLSRTAAEGEDISGDAISALEWRLPPRGWRYA